ncbi:NAD-dependent epimerase/dehydratase family protein [Nannocystis punicea]|uniref:NAD-dependent epimerase/dehydratase family protein n=1 Tax=Nannocystis punicea TaxID=2995304 RepID=A0ABY7GWW5_9BACT|nr:NAD-dependent epimerase/dehydratase family protein [Nannocystis poenicansa]WAS91390.1 NAD-dependent epimerase/dehydratase family protein [Nannocystis poenicansa]
MTHSILITGSEGLVGTALVHQLRGRGCELRTLDLRAPEAEDVRDRGAVARAVAGCSGIVHLAAVSRVIWGERDPALCEAVNIGGTRVVLEAAAAAPQRPWVVFASSREVYGQPDELPVDEDARLAPINVYGRSKVAGEQLVVEARRHGLRTAIVRLSNVYGNPADHPDRVVPAFVRAAVRGALLRVDGSGHTFDFTHVRDVARGLLGVVDLLAGGESPPPIHFLTGQPTTLGELAALVIQHASSSSAVVEAPPRGFDVARFYGSPGRAQALLGWTPQVSLREGLAEMIAVIRAESSGAEPL